MFLLDEMFSAAAARHLREDFGHDAVHVNEVGMRGADDATVAGLAGRERRAMVTENVADFAAEDDLVVVCVLKRNLPVTGAQARGLARVLHQWATANPNPYLGQHWPT